EEEELRAQIEREVSALERDYVAKLMHMSPQWQAAHPSYPMTTANGEIMKINTHLIDEKRGPIVHPAMHVHDVRWFDKSNTAVKISSEPRVKFASFERSRAFDNPRPSLSSWTMMPVGEMFTKGGAFDAYPRYHIF